MNFYILTAFSFSIIIPAVIAAFLSGKIERSYYPFLFCLWTGCANEAFSFILMMKHQQTLVNSNVYVYFEALLLTWYFYRSGFLKNAASFYILLLLLSAVWIAENFITGSIERNSTYFRIASSFLIVILSVNAISKLIFTTRKSILKVPDFILCSCFIIYFTYKALIQAFVLYGSNTNTDFLLKIYIIMIYINLVVNLLYILAVLCMARKKNYTYQY